MRDSVRLFSEQIKGGAVGLFFYAGHGFNVNGENYLVPVDADIRATFDIDDQCLKVSYLLGAMEEAQNRLNIIILDACRNNPFTGARGGGSGLAQMQAPSGSFLAYSTSPGAVASDGPGRNGLYTSMLLKHLTTPGQRLTDLFIQVRNDVVTASRDKQVPWENHSLRAPFYFIPGQSAGATTPAPQLPTGPSAAPDDSAQREAEVRNQWSKWDQSMSASYSDMMAYDRQTGPTARDKAGAWRSFLVAFPHDNPYNTADEDMRRSARQREEYWRSLASAEARAPEAGAPTQVQAQTQTPVQTASLNPAVPSVRITLRSQARLLHDTDVSRLMNRWGFFDRVRRSPGGFANDFEDNGDGTVTDWATGLMWQQDGSPDMNRSGTAYVGQLNANRYAGYTDWRLPTLEELASLLSSRRNPRGLYAAPLFSSRQDFVYSADVSDGSRTGFWAVNFVGGTVEAVRDPRYPTSKAPGRTRNCYTRAVRSLK